MDVGALASQLLASSTLPALIVGLFLLKQHRAKLVSSTRVDDATAVDSMARAEATLSGEALALFKVAAEDAANARRDAGEAREEASRCRRVSVELWASLDAGHRHLSRLEDALERAGIPVPARPAELTPNVPQD